MSRDCPSPRLPDWVPDFVPQSPWYSGHLQTFIQHWDRPPQLHGRFPAQELKLPLDDGTDDCLAATLYSPHYLEQVETAEKRPVIVLLHGLGGTSQSSYIQSSADFLLGKGHHVLLIDFRGAGDSADHCDRVHHPGRAEDIAALLRAVHEQTKSRLREHGVVLVGYSLGGSVLLNFLAQSPRAGSSTAAPSCEQSQTSEQRDSLESVGVLGAVAVSAPLDLEATSRCLKQPSRWIYQRYLLRRMRAQTLRDQLELSDDERQVVSKASSVWDFDAQFTAPRCGFDSVEEYYRAYSAGPKLADIDVPTLLIYALDDPFVPSPQYVEVDWQSLPLLQPLITASGGHCGFRGRDLTGYWHDECVDRFVRRMNRQRHTAPESQEQAIDVA